MTLDLKCFLSYDTKAQATKGKKDKLDFIKIKSFIIKGYFQESEKTTHRMIEDISKSFI